MERKMVLEKIKNEQITIDEGIKILSEKRKSPKKYSDGDIAIIGIAGRFPEAKDVSEFWENLINEKDCISEIPAERWNINKYYSSNNKIENKTYCKMGGTIIDSNLFDAEFFNISPKEAKLMDPQQRVFLEEAWKAVEDAAYTPEQLSKQKCGVFVGATKGDYNKRANDNGIVSDALLLMGNQTSMISARIAYYMNLTGPNLTIDTACSSSLVALHLACQSIRTGESDIALAGGVNILTTPDLYIMASKGEMLSPKGKCKTFDREADGFVPSEGVGVLVLKNANEALRDKDNIYGVIIGSGINYDGKTNGIAAPSAKSQSRLEFDVYQKHSINPETISYIEAHGTGTKLGDPIEIAALKKAFCRFTNKKYFCGIGSVKPNIGHALAASGVISVIKVLLCMKNNLLVPTINYNTLNEEIKLEDSPFYIVDKCKEWEPESNLKRAAVSSFGLSGTNCHIVIEEPSKQNKEILTDNDPYIFLFSAKSEENLTTYLKKFKVFIANTESSLGDIAYTLAFGREKYNIRTYIIAESKEELEAKLIPENLMFYNIQNSSRCDNESKILRDKEWEDNKEKLENIGKEYICGKLKNIDKLFRNKNYKKVSVPSYCFSESKYWIEEKCLENENLDERIEVDKFKKIFHGNEDYIQDHIVEGKTIIPAAAQMAYAYSAIVEYAGWKNIQFRDVQWNTAINANVENSILLNLKESNECIEYEIKNQENKVFSKGIIEHILDDYYEEAKIDVKKLIENSEMILHEKLYSMFVDFGIEYGKSFRVIDCLYCSKNYCISKLHAITTLDEENNIFLNPALIDGIFQTVVGLKFLNGEDKNHYLPFGFKKFVVFRSIERMRYVLAKNKLSSQDSDTRYFDIYIYRDDGLLLGIVQDYQVKLHQKIDKENTTEIGYYEGKWIQQDEFEISNRDMATMILGSDSEILRGIFDKLEGNNIIVSYSDKFEKISDTSYVINRNSQEDYNKLLGVASHIEKIVILEDEENFSNNLEYVDTYKEVLFSLHFLISAVNKNLQKVNLIYINLTKNRELFPFFESIGAYLKTINLESPEYRCRIVHFHTEMDNMLKQILREINGIVNNIEVKYIANKRYVKELHRNEELKKIKNVIRKNGTYLITGGGGIGRLLAQYLINMYNANVIVCSRSKNLELKSLVEIRDKIEYFQADLTDNNQIEILIQDIRNKYGNINGIFHTAGIIKDNFIKDKTIEDINEVIAPKIKGIINLQRNISVFDLDFFVSFSSLGAITGNIGQCDYCYANSFLDSYSRLQNMKLNKKKPMYISINWPLWKEGGMNVSDNIKTNLRKKFGMFPLTSQNAFIALENIISSYSQGMIVMEGNQKEINEKIKQFSMISETQSEAEIIFTETDEEIRTRLKEMLKEILGKSLNFDKKKILDSVSFDNYGIDSIMIVSINNELENKFGNLSKTLLFEYKNVNELTDYFMKNKRGVLHKILNLTEKVCEDNCEEISKTEIKLENKQDDEIVIVGMSGIFPMASNYEEYWENLKNGRDCITEPYNGRERDLLRTYENADGKKTKRWGGFIDDVDKFDATYFNMSPKEVEMIDPQERLFLETVWKTFSDAGYSKQNIVDRNIGVFVGVMYGHYELFGVEETIKGTPMALNSSFSSIANRVSYFFNLMGPSIALDTMCSSSLTALHLACQSIRAGDCTAAIVGGVNLSLHENKYLLLSQGNFLSSDGKCRSFGEGGDGYVPGEGVGALLIKSKSQAIKDRDHIYAKILGSSLNHGGKTNGYTVPNPIAQGKLIYNAIQKAKIPADSISYIEAHGTGTALGDPIEINGLIRGTALTKKNSCAVGSVKSNIGHLEAASGIASIIKVILMFQHEKMVPSIHSETLNENLNLEDSPFYIQQKYEDWIPAYDMKDNNRERYPRRAGISSFGAGGANAHIILEEYKQSERQMNKSISKNNEELVFLFSAETESLLNKYVEKVYRFISQMQSEAEEKDNILKQLKKEVSEELHIDTSEIHDEDTLDELDIDKYGLKKMNRNLFACIIDGSYCSTDIKSMSLKQLAQILTLSNDDNVSENFAIDMESISYTLQVGRDNMNYRLAIFASNINELISRILEFLDGKRNNKILTRNSKEHKMEANEKIDYKKVMLFDLVNLWLQGEYINWNKYWEDAAPTRAQLPIQELNKKRYWYDSFNRWKERKNMKEIIDVTVETTTGDEKKEIDKIVSCEKMDRGIAVIKIQNLRYGNTFTDDLIENLMVTFEEVTQDKRIKVIILTGDKNVFCMGGSKEQLLDISNGKRKFSDAPFLFEGLQKCEVPVISAMQGHASGGGLLFGLYADITIMAREAIYSAPFLKYNFTPGMGATYILPRKMGEVLAKEMLFSAKAYTGEELERKGARMLFYNQDEIYDEAIRIANNICENSREVLTLLKHKLNADGLIALKKAIDEEEKMHRLTFNGLEVNKKIEYYYGTHQPHVERNKMEIRNEENMLLNILAALEKGSITSEQAVKLMEI